MMDKQLKFLQTLASMAEHQHPVGRARLASAVVYKGSIVATGLNQYKSHPFQKQFGCNEDAIFLHAETDAINRSLKIISKNDLTNSQLYVARIKYSDTKRRHLVWGLAMPCPGCQAAIRRYGIKTTYYSTDIGTVGCLPL